jgi:NitT/TauT family transport system substrate-binding protein
VEQARQGNREIWRSLVERVLPWAVRLARMRLPRGLDPEDAVQQALLTAFLKLPDLRNSQAFPAWLAKIIASECFRLTMSQHPETSLERLDECGLMPPAQGQSPEDALYAMQLMAAFDAALEDLPAHLRDICHLHYRRGLSVPEVAQACALPEGTVKKRLFTARPLLQQRLERFRCPGLFRVGYMPISDHLLAMCADRLNQGHSLPLLSRRYLSWATLADDLARGKLDAAFIMAPLALSLRQAGTQLLYVLDGHHDGSAISVSGHPERCRRLGLPGKHSTHRVLLHKYAQEHSELAGLPTLVVNPSSTLTQLRQNEIGSFFCAEPWSAKCASEGLGKRMLRSSDILPGHICCILAVRREFAEGRAEAVADYLRLLLTARDRVCRDLSFAAKVQAAYTGIDAELARQVLDERAVSFDNLAPDQDRIDEFAMLAKAAGVLPPDCASGGFACAGFCGLATA